MPRAAARATTGTGTGREGRKGGKRKGTGTRVGQERGRGQLTTHGRRSALLAAFARCVVEAADSVCIDSGGSRARRAGRPIGGGADRPARSAACCPSRPVARGGSGRPSRAIHRAVEAHLRGAAAAVFGADLLRSLSGKWRKVDGLLAGEGRCRAAGGESRPATWNAG